MRAGGRRAEDGGRFREGLEPSDRTLKGLAPISLLHDPKSSKPSGNRPPPSAASAPQHFERVAPLVLAEARDAPQLGERFDRAGGGGGPEIEAFPPEPIDDRRDG